MKSRQSCTLGWWRSDETPMTLSDKIFARGRRWNFILIISTQRERFTRKWDYRAHTAPAFCPHANFLISAGDTTACECDAFHSSTRAILLSLHAGGECFHSLHSVCVRKLFSFGARHFAPRYFYCWRWYACTHDVPRRMQINRYSFRKNVGRRCLPLRGSEK